MQKKAMFSAVTMLTGLLVSPLATAHSGVHLTEGLVDGFMHPASGLDHLIVAVAAGFWASRCGNHGVRDMVFFLVMLAAGLLLGGASQLLPQLDVTIPLLFLLIVAVIAVAIAAPAYFMYALFGGFALWHGMAHMMEMPLGITHTGYAVGLLLSTGVLLTLGLILRTVLGAYLPQGRCP
jgi:urease accessory protein